MHLHLFRRRLLGIVPVAVIFALSACSSAAGDGAGSTAVQATAPTSAAWGAAASDDASVRRLLDQPNEAWERGDATAYAAFFTEDGDLIAFDGTHVVGRTAIAGFMQQNFDGPLKNTRVSAEVRDLRFLTADVAIMHTEGAVLFPGENEIPASRNSVQTFVATRTDEGWRIAAFHNTRIQPAGDGRSIHRT